jgi:hypothetical protein
MKHHYLLPTFEVLSRLLALLLCCIVFAPMPVQAQSAAASSYRYTTPTGWTRSSDGSIESFALTSEPQSNVQMLLLAPKPLSGDFNAQFATERAALESFWGLRAPQAAAPQSGQISAGPYSAYFASYDSDSGQRYMSFLAMGQQGQFGMLVFVAASSEDFNRLAPIATQLFTAMSVNAR